MIAVLVNAGAVLLGGLIGTLFGKKIKEEVCGLVLKAIGVVVVILGISGVVKAMITVDEAFVISTNYEMILLVCLVLGSIIGGLVNIDAQLTRFGDFVERKINKGKFSAGFVLATVIFCVGAMAIFGSIEAAMGKPTVLYTKAIMDGITAAILASTLGYGVIFSAIPLLLYELLIFGISGFAQDFLLHPDFSNAFCVVGYAILLCIGINFIIDYRKEHIKTANMLPSLFLVIIYYIFALYVFN